MRADQARARRWKPAIVVLTGTSAGVGHAMAAVLAKRGCKIGLIARGAEPLEETRAMVEAVGMQGLRPYGCRRRQSGRRSWEQPASRAGEAVAAL